MSGFGVTHWSSVYVAAVEELLKSCSSMFENLTGGPISQRISEIYRFLSDSERGKLTQADHKKVVLSMLNVLSDFMTDLDRIPVEFKKSIQSYLSASTFSI